jgi:hypothetical protein
VLKRDHSDAEIETLAQEFRESWSEGQVIRSWLRQHSAQLRKLVREDDWSWANIGKALGAAGIAFKTGKPWTGENVRRAVDLAMKPRKVRTAGPAVLAEPVVPSSQLPAPAVVLSSPPLATPRPPGEPEFKIIQRGPGIAARVADQNDCGGTASTISKRGEP